MLKGCFLCFYCFCWPLSSKRNTYLHTGFISDNVRGRVCNKDAEILPQDRNSKVKSCKSVPIGENFNKRLFTKNSDIMKRNTRKLSDTLKSFQFGIPFLKHTFTEQKISKHTAKYLFIWMIKIQIIDPQKGLILVLYERSR